MTPPAGRLLAAALLCALTGGCIEDHPVEGEGAGSVDPHSFSGTSCQSAGFGWLVDVAAIRAAAGPSWTVPEAAPGLAAVGQLGLRCPELALDGRRFADVQLSIIIADLAPTQGGGGMPRAPAADVYVLVLDHVVADAALADALHAVGFPATLGHSDWTRTTTPAADAFDVRVQTPRWSLRATTLVDGDVFDGGDRTLALVTPLPDQRMFLGPDSNSGLRIGHAAAMIVATGTMPYAALQPQPASPAAWFVGDATWHVSATT